VSGAPAERDAGLKNVADTVRLAAQRAPDAPALIEEPRSITWAALDRQADAVAAGFLELDLPRTGQSAARVAVALPQTADHAAAIFGILRAGLVLVPVNPGYTPRELRHVLADSGAVALITTGPVAAAVETIRAECPNLRHVYTVDNAPGTLAFADLAQPSAGPPPAGSSRDAAEDLAVLLYTSGTAGSPKGAMLTHRALIANQGQVAAVDPPIIRSDDVVLLTLPLFHVFGLSASLIGVAYHGACGVLLERFDPGAALSTIARCKVSVVAAVPQMYSALLAAAAPADIAAAFTSVRIAVSGAAPLPPEVADRFQQVVGRPIYQGYGLTETAPVVATGLASPHPKAGSIGRPVPGVEVRLVASDGAELARSTVDGLVRGHDLSGGLDLGFVDDDAFAGEGTDPGEILVRGANLFQGYWPDRSGGPDSDGWWATGDVAYADGDGDLFLVDRVGELILVNGFNVYPYEVESVLAAHPGVAEAAVVGKPDPTTGEAVHAYVVPSPAGVTVEELTVHCAQNLARYKCPGAIELVDALPHSAIGKVRKVALRPDGRESR
jgi:long-chain acyl-CoA synthetase